MTAAVTYTEITRPYRQRGRVLLPPAGYRPGARDAYRRTVAFFRSRLDGDRDVG